jgi:CRP-like cAMP-binding protein
MSVLRPKIDSAALKMLESVPIFSGMGEKDLKGLAKNSLLARSYAEGATVVKGGEPGVGFYLLVDGRAEVRRRGKVLATLGKGDFFGEMALFADAVRSADVVATKASQCLLLTRWEFWSFAMEHPKILRGMLEEMAQRLSKTDAALTDFTNLGPVPARMPIS